MSRTATAATIALIIAMAGVFVALRAGTAAPPTAQEVKVRAGEFWFKPREVTVKPGAIRFAVKNDGLVGHTYVIEKVKDARTDLFDPGKTMTLTVTLQPGKYVAFCDVPGHREAGMEMRIIVK